VAYYIADYWPILPGQFENYWQTPARNWTTKIPKNILRPFANRILATEKQPILDFAHTIFPTRFLRDKLKNHTMLIGNSTIIYGAVDTRLYNHSINNLRSKQNSFVSLLYAGRLTRDKGVHTAIQAIDILIHQMNTNHLKLTIIGSGEADYEDHLRRLVSQSGLDQFVKFLGAQPKEIMPDLYNDADILLFTSIWPEPFGRVIVEAMASGVVVVGAKSGGAAEIMDHNINALVYEPGDAETLANHLHQLIESPQLRYRLAINGQKMASERFNIQRMTSEIEAYLMSII
jgi:glycosyltransferase involved in cell wall biosynthesis